MLEWFAGHVIANGIKLHYHRTGGNKPSVVLLHGMTDAGPCWLRLAQALETDYDLIMPDARGHGLSDAPESSYGREDHAADAAGLIDALGLQKPVLIGHSMGAGAAAVAAATYPDKVGGLVLEDPPWRATEVNEAERAAGAAAWRAAMAANKDKTVEELIALCRQQHPNWDETELRPWAESKQQVSPHAAGFAGGARAAWQETARAIRCPGILITADPALGSIVTPEVAAEAVTLWRQGRVVNLPGAGHNIRREQFAPYLQAVRQFLAEYYGR